MCSPRVRANSGLTSSSRSGTRIVSGRLPPRPNASSWCAGRRPWTAPCSDLGGQLVLGRAGLRVARDHVGRAAHDRQQVVQVVRDAADELAHAVEPAQVVELALEAAGVVAARCGR
jgi:hypothetical protein